MTTKEPGKGDSCSCERSATPHSDWETTSNSLSYHIPVTDKFKGDFIKKAFVFPTGGDSQCDDSQIQK